MYKKKKKKKEKLFLVDEITFALSVLPELCASAPAVPLPSPGQAGAGDAAALCPCQRSRLLVPGPLPGTAGSWRLPLAG